ncbi:Hypothetical protein CINCED_3A006800 [Cinara cedri]|uniref:Uncharacterized protein n=1 Tax=Cinara cedri TaxID=506608 RepID=A0A5E4MUR6_9HEMI|nr:Hypothetical protein CINCED_3A006800 [Cinara cedri]
MIITKEQETEFEKENNSHICEKSLSDLPPILVKRNRIFNEIIDYWQSKIKGRSIVENKNEKERLDLENIE